MAGKSQDTTLILIGHPGSGKSSTGNMIAGKRVFPSAVGSVRITNDVTSTQVSPHITVVDTPGLESAADYERIKDKIKSLIKGDLFYLLTIRTGRCSKEERKMLEDLFKKHKKDLNEKTLIIFTNCKELFNDDNIAANQTFETWLADAPNLKNIIDANQIQYLQFENVSATEEEKLQQLEKLFLTPCLSHIKPPTKKLVDVETTISVTRKELEEFGRHALKFFDKKFNSNTISVTRKELEPFGMHALEFYDKKFNSN